MLAFQAMIETELESYLAGFCSHCNKPREGKLCGCAFPCSLTFKVSAHGNYFISFCMT